MESTASPEFTKLVQDVIAVWNAIGFDCIQACTDVGEPEPQGTDIIEICLDANHMTTHLGPSAKASEELASELIAKYGYEKVLTLIQRHAHL